MLSEKDLIYLGTILILQSPSFFEFFDGREGDAIEMAKKIYNKVFKEDE